MFEAYTVNQRCTLGTVASTVAMCQPCTAMLVKDVNSGEPHQLRMAALNEPFTGDMRGVRGTDYACYRQARKAGLKGTFRALLTSHVHGERSLSSYCDAWNSDGQDTVGLASSLLKKQLLGQELMSCQNSFVVLCIEATSQASSRRRRHAASREQELTSQQYQELLKAIYKEPRE
ncbi:Collagen alpha-1(XVIII) chain [Chionoecetes opilio]|uniref:Collagen alpha-1(XVIII) chain n=1 Tax=Chionoecetes opilio TaxID=41210 RepID=A0A8J4YIL2_CHIOP|nr:Collagen alpha-1(XVIII) chain [Chionoecetes opilio]